MVLDIGKLKICLLSFCLLSAHKQFSFSFCCVNGKMIDWCDHKAITLWMGSKFETTPERCFFVRPLHQLIWDSLFIFVMLTKCCIFAIKTELWLFCQSCLLVRFLMNTATFLLRKLWVFEFLCDSNIGR